jgi:hypothetical protein
LQCFKFSQIFVDRPVDVLFVKAEELKFLRMVNIGVGGLDGFFDFGARVGGGFGEDVVFGGAESVETPAVFGYGMGELRRQTASSGNT